MTLANIIRDDFLSLFDTERIIDSHAHVVQYSITSADGLVHKVYIDPSTQLVGLTMSAPAGSAMNITINKIVKITCHRDEPVAKFCFYQEDRAEPIAEFVVKPSIYIFANAE